MNIISALALVLEGHRLRRKSCLTKEGGSGDYRLDEQIYLMGTDQMRGIVSTSTHSVYGRKQDRTRAALLSSSDILADDWEIADQVYKIRETSIEDRTVHQRDVLFDALWRLSARTGLVDPDMPYGVTELLTAVESGIALLAQAPRDGGETQGGWQPIETAPKDGTQIVIYRPSSWQEEEQHVVSWDEDTPIGAWWVVHDGKNDHLLRGPDPTHWRVPSTPPSGVETIRQDNTSGGK